MKIKTFKWLILAVVSLAVTLTGAYFFIFCPFKNPLMGILGLPVTMIGAICTGFTVSEFFYNFSSTFREKFNANVL